MDNWVASLRVGFVDHDADEQRSSFGGVFRVEFLGSEVRFELFEVGVRPFLNQAFLLPYWRAAFQVNNVLPFFKNLRAHLEGGGVKVPRVCKFRNKLGEKT